MKTKSIFLTVSMITATVVFSSSCSGNKQGADVQTEDTVKSIVHDEVSSPQFQIDSSFQKQLAAVFSSYISLKDAFVSSDAIKVKEEASKTSDALSKVDMKLLQGVAHNDWMTYLSPLQTGLKEIQASTDIEEQRKAFSLVSDNLYKSIKAFGLGGKEVFYEFCPMAFNNEGAYWLSDKAQIRNPYFGDKMLTCGSVKEKLN